MPEATQIALSLPQLLALKTGRPFSDVRDLLADLRLDEPATDRWVTAIEQHVPWLQRRLGSAAKAAVGVADAGLAAWVTDQGEELRSSVVVPRPNATMPAKTPPAKRPPGTTRQEIFGSSHIPPRPVTRPVDWLTGQPKR